MEKKFIITVTLALLVGASSVKAVPQFHPQYGTELHTERMGELPEKREEFRPQYRIELHTESMKKLLNKREGVQNKQTMRIQKLINHLKEKMHHLEKSYEQAREKGHSTYAKQLRKRLTTTWNRVGRLMRQLDKEENRQRVNLRPEARRDRKRGFRPI